jgi:predicted amidohydrolase YtcJ
VTRPAVDLLLRSGRITTLARAGEGPAEVEALAVAGGRVLAAGTDAELAPYAQHAARIVDLDGRRVLPGLVDSHIHAMRAGVSWTVSLHWDDVRSVGEALDTVRARAAQLPAGAWICVIGGWSRRQLAERRLPTPQELTEAAPGHPVYVQETYDVGILNAAGLAACGWSDRSAADPERGRLERDADGAPTGVIFGTGAFGVPTGLALAVDREQAVAGTRAMAREFASHGLTGVSDGGGLMVRPSDYDALFDLWRAGELPLRFRLFVSAWTRGGELGDVAAYTEHQQHDFGDDVLTVSGIGEVVHLGCHDLEGMDEVRVGEEAAAELLEISRLCARRGWRMSMHAVLDETVGRVLDAWEQVEAETGGVRGRRWSIVHADTASPRNLDRIAALGLGVLVQNRYVIKGGDYVERWGERTTAEAQPVAELRARGIPIGAGSDATRANWFSPWASIAWFVTGRSVDGAGARAERHLMSREEALRAYSADAVWFTGDDDRRGRLLPGFDADLMVPTRDPFDCDDDELAGIRSELTIMGGRVTWSSGRFTEGASA